MHGFYHESEFTAFTGGVQSKLKQWETIMFFGKTKRALCARSKENSYYTNGVAWLMSIL